MDLSEEQIFIQAAKHDNQSFIKLYDRYYSKIFGYIFRRTLDFELSKDITSETFLKAYVNIGTFEWRNLPFSAWLFRIATNEMNMAARKKRYRHQSLEILNEHQKQIADPQSLDSEKKLVEIQMKQHEEFIQIQLKLKLLPNKYQEVIALRYFEGKSIKEIAQIINKPDGTIKSLISRGLEKLRLLL